MTWQHINLDLQMLRCTQGTALVSGHLGLLPSAWRPASASTTSLCCCGCRVWQKCRPLYSGPAPIPMYRSPTPHCSLLWEFLWHRRSWRIPAPRQVTASGHKLMMWIQRGHWIIETAKPALHSALSHAFPHRTSVAVQTAVLLQE